MIFCQPSCHVWTAPSWQELSSRKQHWSVQPCVRPLDAVHMTAGHNALRGSGPDQKLAFDNAMALVGCPDRRIDRLCITCCSPSQPSHHAGCPARSRLRRKCDGFLVSLALSHVWTAPSWQELSSRKQHWSVQPCVRPLDAVHMTAGHNALRGSGPDQKLAFDNAMALVGCPDRRIDRLCITCCSPSQPSHHAGCPARSRLRRKCDGFLVSLALS